MGLLHLLLIVRRLLSLTITEIWVTDASSAAFKTFNRTLIRGGKVAQAICRFQQPILLLLCVKDCIVLISAELLIVRSMGHKTAPDDRHFLLLFFNRILIMDWGNGGFESFFFYLLVLLLLAYFQVTKVFVDLFTDISDTRFVMELFLG